MKTTRVRKTTQLILIAFVAVSLSGCLAAKIDKFVSKQYNDELPKLDKKKQKAGLTVTSGLVTSSTMGTAISTTDNKTSKMLPLLVYWSWDHRHTTSLNPNIAVTNFTNAINSQFTKTFSDKLRGRKLELSIEEAPTQFAMVDKAHLVFVLVYVINWDRIYMEPDKKDLIVSYKIIDGESVSKTGKITVQNSLKNQGLRFFQSWKSAVSEQLGNYNVAITTMTKTFLTKLGEEL